MRVKSLMRAESIVLDYLKGEGVTPEGLSQAAAECHRMIDALAEPRVAGQLHHNSH